MKFDALGTSWWITAALTDQQFSQLIEYVQLYEARLSRFIDSSEVSHLNQVKKIENPSADLRELIHISLEYFKTTDGLFNITELPARLDPSLRVSTDLSKDIQKTIEGIQISDDIQLDFGGLGKGFLLDTLLAKISSQTSGEIIVNGGGDLRFINVAEPFPIKHPFENTVVTRISAVDGAIATSVAHGREYAGQNHISVQSSIAQASVVADMAVDADVLATAALSSPDPISFLNERNCRYVVVDTDGIVTTS